MNRQVAGRPLTPSPSPRGEGKWNEPLRGSMN